MVFSVPPVAAWSYSWWCQTAGSCSPGSDSWGSDSLRSDSAWSDSLEMRCYATRRLDNSSMCGLRSLFFGSLGRIVCGVVSPGLGAGVVSGAFDEGGFGGTGGLGSGPQNSRPILLTNAGLSKCPTPSTSQRSRAPCGFTPTRRSHRPRNHPRAQTQERDPSSYSSA